MNESIFRHSKISVASIFFILAFSMLCISIYMTNHYFDTHFPEGITSGSLCNINSFLSCDKTTLSIFSNIAGVPISILSTFLSLFILFGFIFPSDRFEGTTYQLLLLNALGCVALFLISLFVLKTLCPICTLYYIASLAIFFLIHKFGSYRSLDLKYSSALALVLIIASGFTYSYVGEKEQVNVTLKAKLIEGFKKAPKVGAPKEASPYRIASATEKFADAPLRISVFSDFQCPACKMLSDVTHKVAQRFAGKVNIQYFFYPLDKNCNSNMKRQLHPFACKAAYISSCKPDIFDEVHDNIFANQDKINYDWLEALANELGVSDCANSEATKNKVTAMVESAKEFNVQSTPTMILNGVKIEGLLPVRQLMILLESLLE